MVGPARTFPGPYVAPGGLMAVPIAVQGDTLEPGTPATLFPTHIYGWGADAGQSRQYAAAPDGRFLINTVPDDVVAMPVTLFQNWRPPGGAVIVPFCLYFFRSTTHSQCESPRSIFLVSLNVKFGFKLSAAPSPHL